MPRNHPAAVLALAFCAMNPLPGAASAGALEACLHQDDHGRRHEEAIAGHARQAAARRPDGAHGRCGPHGYKTWKELGITVDEHGIGHTNPSDPSRDKNAVPIRKFHAARLADLAKQLAAIPEGNGTMFDNTLIVWMSDSAEELRRNRHSASRAKGPVICQPRATPWVCGPKRTKP